MNYDHYTPPEPTRAQLEQQVEELEAEVEEAKNQRLTFTALHDAVDELSLDDQDMAHRLLGDLQLHAVRGEWAETPTDTAQAMMLAARREMEQLRAELATTIRDLLVAGRGAEVRAALTTAGLIPAQEQTA